MTDAHDITGGLDLLGDWLDAKGYTEEAGLCTRAMDEINRLRLELDMQRAMVVVPSQKDDRHTIEALRAENARLREALKPFAELADWYDTEPDTQPAWDSDYQPTVGQIRAARAAIGETDKRINPEYTGKRMGETE